MNNLEMANRVSELAEQVEDFDIILGTLGAEIDNEEEGSERQLELVKEYNEVNAKRRRVNIERLKMELALEEYEELVEKGEIE